MPAAQPHGRLSDDIDGDFRAGAGEQNIKIGRQASPFASADDGVFAFLCGHGHFKFRFPKRHVPPIRRAARGGMVQIDRLGKYNIQLNLARFYGLLPFPGDYCA
jgi:hypothetical protein